MHMQDVAFLAALMGAIPASAVAQGAHGARALPPAEATVAVALASRPTGRGAPRVPVAAHDIARGAVLRPGDIAWSDTTAVEPGEHFDVQPGWVARRPFHTGDPLAEPGVARPDLVTTGDVVDVVYRGGGVAIRVRGTAVGSGAAGDVVYVRLDNRRRLRGVVDGAHTVRVQ